MLGQKCSDPFADDMVLRGMVAVLVGEQKVSCVDGDVALL